MTLPGYLHGEWGARGDKYSKVNDRFFSATIGCQWSWGFRCIGRWSSVEKRKRSVVKPCVG